MTSMYSYLSTHLRKLFTTYSKTNLNIAAAEDLLRPPYENINLAKRMLTSRLISSGAAPELEQEIETYISAFEDFLARGVDEYFIIDPEKGGYDVNLRGLRMAVWKYSVWFETIDTNFDRYFS
ncbi:hypothetical protein RUND412_006927 [Rhizina undulata]